MAACTVREDTVMPQKKKEMERMGRIERTTERMVERAGRTAERMTTDTKTIVTTTMVTTITQD